MFEIEILELLVQKLDVHKCWNIPKINRDCFYLFRVISPKWILRFPTKHEQLLNFNLFYNWLPEQGSQQWLDQRNGIHKDYLDELIYKKYGIQNKPVTVGGSEIHKIIRNEYSNDLFKSKTGQNKFTGNLYTRWGNMFEPMITRYCEYLFHTHITETGALPVLRNQYFQPVAAYSPDGLATVSGQDLIENFNHVKWINTVQSECKYNILFEFKCPFSRPVNGKIKPEYMSQISMGMNSIPIVDLGIFADGQFRKCSMQQFNWNTEYCKEAFPADNNNRIQMEQPKALGVIGIYKKTQPVSNIISTQQNFNELTNTVYDFWYKLSAFSDNSYPDQTDFINQTGIQLSKPQTVWVDNLLKKFNQIKQTCNLQDWGGLCNFDQVMYECFQPDYSIKYSDILLDNTINANAWLTDQINHLTSTAPSGHYLHAVIPWKLFKISTTLLQPPTEFMENVSQKIYNFVDRVLAYKSEENPEHIVSGGFTQDNLDDICG